MDNEKWQQYRTGFAIIAGAITLFSGVLRSDPATMTIGAGLIGFSPAAKGPVNATVEPQKLVVP